MVPFLGCRWADSEFQNRFQNFLDILVDLNFVLVAIFDPFHGYDMADCEDFSLEDNNLFLNVKDPSHLSWSFLYTPVPNRFLSVNHNWSSSEDCHRFLVKTSISKNFINLKWYPVIPVLQVELGYRA